MTSGRFWLIAAALATPAIVAIACGGNNAPCSTCAPIEGHYPLEFAAGDVPTECASLGVALPKGALDIQRAGSQITATLDDVPMQGTLFQSSEFNLLGTQAATDGGSGTQFAFSGTYTPGRPDAGTGHLSGSFTGTYTRPSPQGSGHCTLPRAYTATQQPAQP